MADVELGAIQNFLLDRGVFFQTRDGGLYDYKFVEFRYTADQLNIDCTLNYTEGNDVFTVYAMTQDEFDAEYKDEIVKIANRANHWSKYGSMIVGTIKDTGRFSVWFRLTNAGVQAADPIIVDAMISNACGALGEYYPALMKVAWGGMSAEEAIEFAFRNPDESGSSPPPNISGYE